MPPFVGTDDERAAVAAYLAVLGGARPTDVLGAAAVPAAGRIFEDNCAGCHGPDGDFQIGGRRTAPQFYERLGRLPQINDVMPAFPGNDEQRHAMAEYLAALPVRAAKGGAR